MRAFVSTRRIAAIAAMGVLCATPTAHAGLGNMFVRGLTYTLNSSSFGTPQNGPNFNENQFAQRVSRDYVGNGYSYDFTKIWGLDSFGNADTLNLGLLDVQLRAPDGSGLRGAGVYNRVGYTTRLVPEFFFESRSTGQNATAFTGTQAVPAPIQYRININNGVEQLALAGAMIYNTRGSLNGLGFYQYTMTASNTGTATTSGVTDNRTQDISFDIGPVTISGNVLIDMGVAAFKSVAPQLGVPVDLVTALPGGFAARIRTPDEISKAIEAGQSVSYVEFQSLIQAYVTDPQNVHLPVNPNANGSNSTTTGGAPAGSTNAVPEPGTFALLGLGLLVALTRHHRRTA